MRNSIKLPSLIVGIGFIYVFVAQGQDDKAKIEVNLPPKHDAWQINTYTFALPVFDTVSQKQAGALEARTDELIALQSRMRRDLLTQLQERKLSGYAKGQLIRLLGAMQAQEATFELIKEVNFQDRPEQFTPSGKIRGGFVARRALVQIGSFAATAIFSVIECVNQNAELCFDKSQADGFAIVLHDIKGPKPALRTLRERQAQATDPKVRAQYQIVIKRFISLFPETNQPL